MQLKFLTLNCWGVIIQWGCKYRHERMQAIADELLKGEYDIVALEEVWSEADRDALVEKLKPVLPYSYCYYSHLVGSGLCVFSKHPIVDTFYYRYRLNAYAHRSYDEGDWACGKGVGLARIDCNGFRINVYLTHIQSQHSEPNDVYVGHRVSQAFELSQFVRLTSEACDAVIVTGDMNSRPDSVSYKLLTSNAVLQDAWLDQKVKPEDVSSGNSFGFPSNSFRTKYWLAHFPIGERLDYILYRNNQGCSMDCDNCCLTMGTIPGQTYNYSDHEGVKAVFNIRRNPTALPKEADPIKRNEAMNETTQVLTNTSKMVEIDTLYFAAAAVLTLFTIILLSTVTIPLLSGIVKLLLSLVLAYFVANAVVIKRIEKNDLRDIRGHIQHVQQSYAKMK